MADTESSAIPRQVLSTPDAIPRTARTADGLADGAVDDLAEDNARLVIENAQLLQAVESHAVIDQARGILMAGYSCSSQAAWDLLVEVSQHSNVKLRAVAEALVATAEGPPLPPDIAPAMQRALIRLRADSSSRS